MILRPAFILLAISTGGVASAAEPVFSFRECDSCGIGAYRMAQGLGAGLAAADFDDDGDVDLFVPTESGTPDQLYRNRGDGGFEDIAALVGLASIAQSRCALWLDGDGDGRLDLLVANDDPDVDSTYRYYRQVPGLDGLPHFADVTADSGLYQELPDPRFPGGPAHRGGLSAGDLDHDGDPDVVSCLWNGDVQILRNDGGFFTDITAACGVETSLPFSHQSVIFDVDGDGWQDIFIAVDFHRNALYVNRRDGTFVDVAKAAGADNAWNDMGIAIGDVDRDGDFDLYVTNITAPGTHNILLVNDSAGDDLRFHEMSRRLGVDEGGWGWGTTFLDADNDGWLDVAATNGSSGGEHGEDPSRFYWARPDRRMMLTGPPPFSDVSAKVGFADTEWGSSLVAFDVDRDGDLDLVQACMNGPLRVLLNDAAQQPDANGWLVVRPRMIGANGRAIGAVVRVTTGRDTQTRLITAGTSYLGQEPAEAHFGIGRAETIDVVEVRWPDGRVSCVRDVVPNALLDIVDLQDCR